VPAHAATEQRSRARTAGAVGPLLLTLGLLFAAPAAATYEQVASFGAEKEIEQARSVAVNYSGTGGVPSGSVYVVRSGGSPNKGFVVRYNAKGEFLGGWNASGYGIAVHQGTGNVYVLDQVSQGNDAVYVYNADGSELITSFAEKGAASESLDESPEKLHDILSNSIAVDNSGTAYIFDRNNAFENRVMLFEPQSPGDYEHYVYAGRANDFAEGYGVRDPVLDSAGNLYAVAGEEEILQFSPADPTTPACKHDVAGGGAQAITVDPQSGEIFYFRYSDKEIHQLAACDEGKFVKTSSFAPSPKTETIVALAINPTLAYEPSRPPGALYAVEPGFIFAPAESHLPEVLSQSVSSVTSTTATLGAEINPKGAETRYVFQYLTEAEYEENEPEDRFAGAIEAPLGGAELGTGQKALSAGVSLIGLDPDTTYRFRAIATSNCDPGEPEEICEDAGEAQAFHTYPVEAPGLPDNRAWELVSPAQKHGGEVIPADPTIASCEECKPASSTNPGGFPKQSAPGGDAVVYEGFPFSTTEGAAVYNQYISRRTASGWQTTILSPLLHDSANTLISAYRAFDAELTEGLLSQGIPALSPDAPAEYPNLYTQPTATPIALSPLLGFAPPNRAEGNENLRLTYAGASADFSSLFFEANDALTGETPFAPEAVDGGKEKNNLYEWTNGQLQLVNVLPGNTETVPGAAFGSGKQLKSGDLGNITSVFTHAISADGSRVFWSDEAGQLYVRENGESTIAIPDPGRFLSASADGSKVLLSNGHLYELGAEEPTVQEIADLSQGQGGFQGVLGQSEDLSHVYFVETAALAPGAEAGTCEASGSGAPAEAEGKVPPGLGCNLYAYDEGVLTFIATLAARDNETIGANGATGDWKPSPSNRTAEASPNGRWLAFASRVRLTGYDNTGPCATENQQGKTVLVVVSGPCLEVFLYDSETESLTCPSCNPSGANPLGNATLRVIRGARGSLPQPRYLLDSGRLYFDSQDSLSPFDTNERVEDVYQYEPEGVGSCKRAGGCVNLISAGHEAIDSNLLAVDATGKNVFFTTRDQLVLNDRDDLIDLYVAREGGGIPSETEAKQPPCQGEACQPPVFPPNDPTPASSTFEGAGNVIGKAAVKCAKGKVRRRGRCVKKRRHRRADERATNHERGGRR
jgi:hypothetical protein